MDAIDRLKHAIETEQARETFAARVYDIESASLRESYDLILSTVVFQFLQRSALPNAIANMQDRTHARGYHFIIAPISSSDFPCPINFASTFAPQELRQYYDRWDIHTYQEQPGTFHRKDERGHPIQAMFATLLAQKSAEDPSDRA